MKRFYISVLSLLFILSACTGETETSDMPEENEQPTEDTKQSENIPDFSKENAVDLMNTYKETMTSLFNEAADNDQKIVSFQSKEEIKNHFKNVMSDKLAESMTDSYFTDKDDGVYVIAKDGPIWLDTDQPFELEEVTDKHIKIVQERENELIGHVKVEYHAVFKNEKWIVDEVNHTALNQQSSEDTAKEDPDNNGETITNTAQNVIKLIASKDMNTLASYIHSDKGVLFSPYVYINEDAVVFEQDEVKTFFDNDQSYEWGVYDGRGNTIELTPSEYYQEFIYDKDFQNADEILVDEAKQRGNMMNNIKDIFPNATVVEFYMEGSEEEYKGMDWASLNLVFEQNENNEWKLVAIVHDEWTI